MEPGNNISEQKAESYGEITIIPSRIYGGGDLSGELKAEPDYEPVIYIDYVEKKELNCDFSELRHQAEMYLKDPLFVSQDLREVFDKIKCRCCWGEVE